LKQKNFLLFSCLMFIFFIFTPAEVTQAYINDKHPDSNALMENSTTPVSLRDNELYGYTEDQLKRALACGAVYKKVTNMLLESQNTKFVFNKDYKVRDKILDIEVRWGKDDWDGIYYFDFLDVSSFENLLQKKFIYPPETQNESLSAKDFFLFMSKHPNVLARGYAVSPNRDDYRVTIVGLYVPREFVTPHLKKEFIEFCNGADEISTENGLYSWWD